MTDIFISYSRKDVEMVSTLALTLKEMGYTVWWDVSGLYGGQSFAKVIQEKLSEAKCCIVIWSESSVTSNWVHSEASFADARKILLTVSYQNVQAPMPFNNRHNEDLQGWSGNIYDDGYQKFLKAIARLCPVPSDKLQQLKTGLEPKINPDTTTASSAESLSSNIKKVSVIGVSVVVLIIAFRFFYNAAIVEEVNADAAASSQRAASAVSAVLNRTQPSIDLQVELLGVTVSDLQNTLARAPDNIPALYIYSATLIRLAQLEGHPLYLSQENPSVALGYLRAASDTLGRVKRVMQKRGLSQVYTEEYDGLIDLEIIEVDQLTVERLSAEIQLYYESESKSKEYGLTLLRDVEEKLLGLNYTPTNRKRKISYVQDLVFLAHARLLIGDIKVNTELLEKARTILITIAARPLFFRDDTMLSARANKLEWDQNQAEIDILKNIRFLDSFILEQEAYQAVLQGNLDEASQFYQRIAVGRTGSDVDLSLLKVRVSFMQACIAFDQNKQTKVKQLRESIITSLVGLLEDHPAAKRYSMIHRQITDESLTLEKQLNCSDPRFIIFPLRKVRNGGY